jgi:hypothetical protein
MLHLPFSEINTFKAKWFGVCSNELYAAYLVRGKSCLVLFKLLCEWTIKDYLWSPMKIRSRIIENKMYLENFLLFNNLVGFV